MPPGSRRAIITPASAVSGQPVTAAPAQRGDRRPVRDPPRGIDAAEPVDHLRPAAAGWPAASDGPYQALRADDGPAWQRG